MNPMAAIKKYGYVILMLSWRDHTGRINYEFECYRRPENAEKAKAAARRRQFTGAEFVTMTDAKRNGFEPEPAFFWDEYYEVKQDG